MVALTYENLGGISGVTENPKAPASKRSRDRNDKQRISFSCDRARPFTGVIHVQASVSNPNEDATNMDWFDIAEMVIDNEGGSWSYEPEGEFSSVRVVCRDGNYWSSNSGGASATVSANGNFSIDGNVISVIAGDDATAVATAINSDATIQATGTIFADVTNSTTLRIYKTDGTPMVLADVTGTPLADMGMTLGDIKGGVIKSIDMLR